MSRYLTPTKICLLVLIKAYCEGRIPPDGVVPILSAITSHLVPNTASSSSSTHEDVFKGRALSTSGFKALLENFTAIEQPRDEDEDDDEGEEEQSSERTVWGVFLQNIWKIRDMDAFFSFFSSCVDLYQPRTNRKTIENLNPNVTLPIPAFGLLKSSLFGTFIRRAQLEFERLPFHEVMKLWTEFKVYRGADDGFEDRHTSRDMLDRTADLSVRDLDEASGGMAHAVIYRAIEDDPKQYNGMSTTDVERLLEFQIEKMQKLGVRLSEELQEQFRVLLQAPLNSSSLSHYARFLDAWYSGDYPSSFENLHRYYDYGMHNKDRSHYQYALLNMAILQADFGCIKEAMAAMEETIATARENKDTGCLNFSLSWLYHFRTIHKGAISNTLQDSTLGSDVESLAFLKARAKEAKMWIVVSSTLLNEAKLCLSQGRKLRDAFASIHESSHLNVHYNINGVQSAQLLVQASIFGRLGITTLSISYCQLVIDCYMHSSPIEEIMKARCRLAYAAALQGDYAATKSHLDQLEPQLFRNLKHNQFLSSYIGILKLKRLLHHNDLHAAENLLDMLKHAPFSDPELAFQISILEIDYLMRLKSFTEALQNIEHLIAQCATNDADVHHRIRLLSLKAFLFAKCERPQKGLVLAIRAATAAYQIKALPALWEAVAALSLVLIGVEEFHAATKVVESVLYQAMETYDYALIALLQSIAADAYTGCAGQAPSESKERNDALARAISLQYDALISSGTIQDFEMQCEALAKLTVLCRLLKRTVDAEKYASLYERLRRSETYPVEFFDKDSLTAK